MNRFTAAALGAALLATAGLAGCSSPPASPAAPCSTLSLKEPSEQARQLGVDCFLALDDDRATAAMHILGLPPQDDFSHDITRPNSRDTAQAAVLRIEHDLQSPKPVTRERATFAHDLLREA